MASLTYTSDATEDAVLAFVAAKGGQTAAQYFTAFVKAELNGLRLQTLADQTEAVKVEIDAAFRAGKALSVTKDTATGFPRTARV